MKKRALMALHLFIIPAVFYLFPMDWPSPQGIITRNFGWNDRGLPHLGISFSSEGSIGAAEDGELLFRCTEGYGASRLPSPLGSWIALDHGDGIISIYARFSGGRLEDANNEAANNNLRKGSILGASGMSGWSSGGGFYFQLFDRKERRWINPSMIITPSEDSRPPVILSVRLKNEKGDTIDPSQTRAVNQGRYFVYVDAMDTMRQPNENPLAPYRIICSINGSETGVLNFETYSARDGTLMVYRNGLVRVKQVYAPFPAYEVADVWLSRGQTTLEIIAQDIAGNVRNIVYRLMVE